MLIQGIVRLPFGLMANPIDILPSPRLGLQEICSGEHAKTTTSEDRINVHQAEDSFQLFQLQCMAPEIQGPIILVGQRQAQ